MISLVVDLSRVTTGRAVPCSCWCLSWLVHCDWLAVVYWDGVTNTHNSITEAVKQSVPNNSCLSRQPEKLRSSLYLNVSKQQTIFLWIQCIPCKSHLQSIALRQTMSCTVTQIPWFISFGDKRDFIGMYKWFTVKYVYLLSLWFGIIEIIPLFWLFNTLRKRFDL